MNSFYGYIHIYVYIFKICASVRVCVCMRKPIKQYYMAPDKFACNHTVTSSHATPLLAWITDQLLKHT